jgi:hypothetical protein
MMRVWERRAAYLQLFSEQMYGPEPPAEPPTKPIILSEESLPGGMLCQSVRLNLGVVGPVLVRITRPKEFNAPLPAFVMLSFSGMESVESAVSRGYAVVTVCYEEIAADRSDALVYASGYKAISLWAWGLSRLVDYLETVDVINVHRLIAIGHSRLGKAALLAAARDLRFAACIPHQSGCGGAAPSRGLIGESVARINTMFPHWFSEAFKGYNDRVNDLPFEQSDLIACVAPRPILISNAIEDEWANPEGQFAMLDAATKIYATLGADDGRCERFLRPGGHAVTPEDWGAFLAFADRRVSLGLELGRM